MKNTCLCVVGLLAASVAHAQSTTDVQWPAIALAAPGTANLTSARLTSLPVGFTQDTVATFSQRCSFAPPTTAAAGAVQATPQMTCDIGSGNPKLLVRQGTLLTRTGDTLLANEQAFTQGTAALGTITAGVDLLQENLQTTQSTIRNLLRVENPELSCATSGNVATRTERSILGFTFNEPLNVLYVLTLNSKTYYAVDPQRIDPLACVVPTGVAVPFIQDTTRTLIRVKGFSAAMPPALTEN
jgi:hypothetical protein